MGEPKMPTPEEMAKRQKERALSDFNLIQGGAEYDVDENRATRLDLTEEQMAMAKKDMLIEKKTVTDSYKLQTLGNAVMNMADLGDILKSKVDKVLEAEKVELLVGDYDEFLALNSDKEMWGKVQRYKQILANIKIKE